MVDTRYRKNVGCVYTLKYHALEIMLDYVHLFVESDPTKAPAHLAAQFKGYTSRVLRQEFPWLRSRLPALWSRSYYVGSVGHVVPSDVAVTVPLASSFSFVSSCDRLSVTKYVPTMSG